MAVRTREINRSLLPSAKTRATIAKRLAGVTGEQLLAGLTPEQIADLVAHLPPEVREAVKKRMS